MAHLARVYFWFSMKLLETIGQVWSYNLRLKRGKRTQSEIAKGAGLSLRAYNRMESGVLPKSPKTITALSKSLGVTEISLFIDPDDHKKFSPIPDDIAAGLLKLDLAGLHVVRVVIDGMLNPPPLPQQKK